MKEIQGHGVAMITPFKRNGTIDLDFVTTQLREKLETNFHV